MNKNLICNILHRTRTFRGLFLLSLQLSFLPCYAAALKEVTNFGDNPAKLKMFLYVPDIVKKNPAILVGLHWCHGTAQNYYSGTAYKTQADQYGFIVIYPSAVSTDSCFDVHSQDALSHSGKADPGSIVSMIKYVIQNYNADSTRVFVTGHSGGGMMTNVMAGSYPEVFAAASASASVPFGCFGEGNYTWNDNCAKGRITKTPQEWGDLVRNAYTGYTGPRPRIQLWHGTNDDVLVFKNFEEAIEQWTNVAGMSQTPSSTELNTPLASYTRTRYTDNIGIVQVEAIKAQGQPHNVKIVEQEVIKFFGLDKTTEIQSTLGSNVHRSVQTSLCIDNILPGEVRFSLTTLPGFISFDIYTLSGTKILHIPEQYSGNGKIQTSSHVRISPSACIVVVKINRLVAGKFYTVLF